MAFTRKMDAAGNWEYHLQDGLGSVRGLASGTNAVLWSSSYDPFGQDFGGTGTWNTTYGFTGERYSAGGLYLRARHYNPTLGIFAGLDPFEGLHQRPMSLNGYSWVEGNVTNLVDRTGRQTPCQGNQCLDVYRAGGGANGTYPVLLNAPGYGVVAQIPIAASDGYWLDPYQYPSLSGSTYMVPANAPIAALSPLMSRSLPNVAAINADIAQPAQGGGFAVMRFYVGYHQASDLDYLASILSTGGHSPAATESPVFVPLNPYEAGNIGTWSHPPYYEYRFPYYGDILTFRDSGTIQTQDDIDTATQVFETYATCGVVTRVQNDERYACGHNSIFRSMIEAPDGLPMTGDTRRTLGAVLTGDRPDIVVVGGMVSPNVGGMSVTPGTPFAMPSSRRPPAFGGTGKDSIWCSDAWILPAFRLQYRPDPINSSGHGFVEPATIMTSNQYQNALWDTRAMWSKIQS